MRENTGLLSEKKLNDKLDIWTTNPLARKQNYSEKSTQTEYFYVNYLLPLTMN